MRDSSQLQADRFARVGVLGRIGPMRVLLALVGLVVALSASAQTAPPAAATNGTPDRSLQPRQPRDRSSFALSVVGVQTQVPSAAQSSRTLGGRRSGTGLVIGDQVVLTIGYLLLEADQVMLTTTDGRRVPAAVAGYDHASGFGVIRSALPLNLPAFELGDSEQLTERQQVLTIGFGESDATELMVISRKAFAGSWEYLLERPIFTTPPVSNWSGSALLSEQGLLLGVGSLVVQDAASAERGVPGNLFVPINLLKPILADLISKGRRAGPVQPWLGLSAELVQGKSTVARVSPDGPADLAGIQVGDVVVGVDAEYVVDLAEFYRKISRRGPAGVTVPLQLLRDGAPRQVQVRSIDRSDFIAKPSGI